MGEFVRLADLLLTNDLDTALRLLDRQVTTGGGGGFLGLGIWRYRTSTTSTPNTGQLQFDNTTIASATELYVHAVNDNGSDMSVFLDLLTEFDLMYIQVQVDASQFVTIQIGTPSLASSVYTFPILQIQGQGTTPSNNTEVAVVIEQSGIGSGVTDHGALSGLSDDDHLQYLHKDITRHLTVGYTTDIEADTFTNPLVPDFSLEYFKTMTVTSDFTLDTPTGNSHGEYYLTVDSGGPYTLAAGTNVTLMDSNVTMEDSSNYILNIHRYSATNTLAQLTAIPLLPANDPDAIHDNVAAEISAIADKATPVAADHLIIEDSEAGDVKKDITIGSQSTALEGVIDRYNLINGGSPVSPADATNWNADGNTAVGDATNQLLVSPGTFHVDGEGEAGTDAVGGYPTGSQGFGIDAETHFAFIPEYGALRAGTVPVNGGYWSELDMGVDSVGLGNNTWAPGDYSVALGGPETYAVQTSSVSIGANQASNASRGVSIGSHSLAFGGVNDGTNGSTMIGGNNTIIAGVTQGALLGIECTLGRTGKSGVTFPVGVGGNVTVEASQGVGLGVNVDVGSAAVNSSMMAAGVNVGVDATQAVCIGTGVSQVNNLNNTTANTMWMGVGSDEPTFIMRNSSPGVGTFSNIGIIQKTPLSTLDIGGSVGFKYTNVTGSNGATKTILATEDEYTFRVDLSALTGGSDNYDIVLPQLGASTIDRRVYYFKVTNITGLGASTATLTLKPDASDQLEDWNKAVGPGGELLAASVGFTIPLGDAVTVSANNDDGAWWVI